MMENYNLYNKVEAKNKIKKTKNHKHRKVISFKERKQETMNDVKLFF